MPEATTATITVTLPKSSGASGVMKVYLNSTLYNSDQEQFPREVSFSGETITITLKGSGENNTYQVVIDDQEIQSGRIDFTKSPAAVSDVKKTEFPIAVPSVVGKSVADAKTILENAGFKNITVVDTEGNKVSAGTVKSQSPEQNEKIVPSAEIKLTVE